MKKILVLNGSPRKRGKTASLVRAFVEGAESAGNEVRELYIDGLDIRSCKACETCSRNGGFCVQKDDMAQVEDAYLWCDVLVFASPMYWGTITGQLKVVVDRLYALQNRLGMAGARRECAFIMTARGNYYQQALDFYSIFTRIMGWPDWGRVLGAGKEDEARALGARIA